MEIFRESQHHQSHHHDDIFTDDDITLQTIRDNAAKRSASATSTKHDGITVGGEKNMLITYCKNCNPIHGEPIQAVVTQGRGFKVHRLDCQYLLQADQKRTVDANWDASIAFNSETGARPASRPIRLDVVFEDTPGMLAGMSGAISSVKAVSIDSVVMKKLSYGRGLARFGVMVPTVDEYDKITRHLEQERGVLSVTRR